MRTNSIVGRTSGLGSFAFIGNILRVECSLPAEVIPGHWLRRAGLEQISCIHRYLDDAPQNPMYHVRARYECEIVLTPVDNGESVSFEEISNDEWKYFVIAFDGNNSKISRLQEAANLADLELELPFTLIQHGQGSGRLWNPDVVYHYYQSADLHEAAVTSVRLQQIGALAARIESVTPTHPDLYRAVRMFSSLKNLPRKSEFQVLGLFSIIELLLTHAPAHSELGDSISHQVRTKIPLLSRHSGQPIEYGAFFLDAKESKLWNLLYHYRSQLAHGGRPDFGGKLRLLKNQANALGFLRYATKSLLRYALAEPQLYADLKKC